MIGAYALLKGGLTSGSLLENRVHSQSCYETLDVMLKVDMHALHAVLTSG